MRRLPYTKRVLQDSAQLFETIPKTTTAVKTMLFIILTFLFLNEAVRIQTRQWGVKLGQYLCPQPKAELPPVSRPVDRARGRSPQRRAACRRPCR